MAGSSGMQFARVAARHGIVGRRQLASWGVEHLRYRLRGTTDERTTEVLKVARELITGVPARDDRADGPGGDGGDPAAGLPADARRGLRPPGRRPRRPSSSAPPATAWSSRWRTVLGMDGGIGTRYEVDADGAFTGRFDGPFVYGAGQGRGDGGLRRRARHRPRRLLRLLRLALRPADAARGRQPGRRQPRPARWPRSPSEEGWQTMRFERLGRRLVAVAVTAAGDRRRLRRLPRRRAAARPPPPPLRRSPVRRRLRRMA